MFDEWNLDGDMILLVGYKLLSTYFRQFWQVVGGYWPNIPNPRQREVVTDKKGHHGEPKHELKFIF